MRGDTPALSLMPCCLPLPSSPRPPFVFTSIPAPSALNSDDLGGSLHTRMTEAKSRCTRECIRRTASEAAHVSMFLMAGGSPGTHLIVTQTRSSHLIVTHLGSRARSLACLAGQHCAAPTFKRSAAIAAVVNACGNIGTMSVLTSKRPESLMHNDALWCPTVPGSVHPYGRWNGAHSTISLCLLELLRLPWARRSPQVTSPHLRPTSFL